MSGVTVSYDLAGLGRLFDAAMDGAVDLMEFGLEESGREVPIEEGTLSRSGSVSVDRGQGVVQISYDTPYAVVQHEDESLRHDAGRKAKFLEDPMLQSVAPAAEAHIGEAIRRAVQ